MAAKMDLGKMSLEELRSLKKDVDKAISGYQDRQRAEALKKVEAIAREHGMSVEELVGKKTRKAKAPAKYRNPEKPGDTWSGRGRQPAWFKNALASGTKPESLEV
jgi:DNA-binding protein H-NS